MSLKPLTTPPLFPAQAHHCPLLSPNGPALWTRLPDRPSETCLGLMSSSLGSPLSRVLVISYNFLVSSLSVSPPPPLRPLPLRHVALFSTFMVRPHPPHAYTLRKQRLLLWTRTQRPE